MEADERAHEHEDTHAVYGSGAASDYETEFEDRGAAESFAQREDEEHGAATRTGNQMAAIYDGRVDLDEQELVEHFSTFYQQGPPENTPPKEDSAAGAAPAPDHREEIPDTAFSLQVYSQGDSKAWRARHKERSNQSGQAVLNEKVHVGDFGEYAGMIKEERLVVEPSQGGGDASNTHTNLQPIRKDNFKYVFQSQPFQYERSDWFFHSRTVECSNAQTNWDLNLFTGPGEKNALGSPYVVYGLYAAWFLLHLGLVLFANNFRKRGLPSYGGSRRAPRFVSRNSGSGGGKDQNALNNGGRTLGSSSGMPTSSTGTHLTGAKKKLGRKVGTQQQTASNSHSEGAVSDGEGEYDLDAALNRQAKGKRVGPTDVLRLSLRVSTASADGHKDGRRLPILDYTRFVCVAATICMHLDGYRYSIRNTGFVLFWVMPFLFMVSGIAFQMGRRPFPMYMIKLCVLALVGMGLNALGQIIEFGSVTGNPDMCVTSASVGQMWYVIALVLVSSVFYPFKLLIIRNNRNPTTEANGMNNHPANLSYSTASESSGGSARSTPRAPPTTAGGNDPAAPSSRRTGAPAGAWAALGITAVGFLGCVVTSALLAGGGVNKSARTDWGSSRPYKGILFLLSELFAFLVLVSAALIAGDKGFLTWILASWTFLSPIFFPVENQFFGQMMNVFWWAALVYARPLRNGDKLANFFQNYWIFMVLAVLASVYVDQIGRCDIYPAERVWERFRWFGATGLLCLIFASGALFGAEDPHGITRWTNYWSIMAYVSCQFVGNIFAKVGPGKWFGAPVLYLSILSFVIWYHLLPEKGVTEGTQTGVTTRPSRGGTGETGGVMDETSHLTQDEDTAVES